jgi:hypothetical protein
MDATTTGEDLLRHEASGLAVDDILAVCYALQQKPQPARLRLYLDVLRRRGGDRASFACALICFDLARQGDSGAQRDFQFLADTMRTLAESQELVTELLGGDRYLSYVWELCRAQLEEMDPRFVEPEPEIVEAAEMVLLSDADFADELPTLDIDDVSMRRRFDDALDAFLGGVPGQPIYDMDSGFRVKSGRDVERVEAFLRELDSLKDYVRIARGYRALTLLFYGTHMRSKSIFGAPNTRKQELLRDGLEELLQSGGIVAEISGVLGPLHADPDVWPKVADVIQDYLAVCAADPEAARAGPSAYDAVGRLVVRDQARGRTRR